MRFASCAQLRTIPRCFRSLNSINCCFVGKMTNESKLVESGRFLCRQTAPKSRSDPSNKRINLRKLLKFMAGARIAFSEFLWGRRGPDVQRAAVSTTRPYLKLYSF
jgi:hypothetical protein